jgi:hypothetical protein
VIFLNLLVLAFTLVMLARHGPRAVLAIAPRSVRVTGDADAPPRTTGMMAAGELLEGLGFRRLGLRAERSPLRGLDMEVDAWVHPDGTCADAYPTPGRDVLVAFLTTFADGYQLGTSNFRRLAAENARGRVGGLKGTAAEGALAAHRKAAAALVERHGAPRVPADLAARVAAARDFYAGVGAAEMRRPAFLSLVNAALALVLLASSIKLLLRAAGVIP